MVDQVAVMLNAGNLMVWHSKLLVHVICFAELVETSHTIISPDWTFKKMEPLQFCLPALLEINHKQKEVLKSCEGVLR